MEQTLLYIDSRHVAWRLVFTESEFIRKMMEDSNYSMDLKERQIVLPFPMIPKSIENCLCSILTSIWVNFCKLILMEFYECQNVAKSLWWKPFMVLLWLYSRHEALSLSQVDLSNTALSKVGRPLDPHSSMLFKVEHCKHGGMLSSSLKRALDFCLVGLSISILLAWIMY